MSMMFLKINCVHLLSSSPRPALNRLITNPGLVSFQTPLQRGKESLANIVHPHTLG